MDVSNCDTIIRMNLILKDMCNLQKKWNQEITFSSKLPAIILCYPVFSQQFFLTILKRRDYHSTFIACFGVVALTLVLDHCVKVSKYGVFSGSYFPVFGLNTEIYTVYLCIQSEYRKIRTKKNSVFGHLHSVDFNLDHCYLVFFGFLDNYFKWSSPLPLKACY